MLVHQRVQHDLLLAITAGQFLHFVPSKYPSKPPVDLGRFQGVQGTPGRREPGTAMSTATPLAAHIGP